MREQQYITDRSGIREQHHQSVYTDTLTCRRWQTVFQGTDIIGIIMHGFVIAGFFFLDLLPEALGLILRIVQLGKTIGDFTAADKEFETICDKGILVIAARQR